MRNDRSCLYGSVRQTKEIDYLGDQGIQGMIIL